MAGPARRKAPPKPRVRKTPTPECVPHYLTFASLRRKAASARR